MNTVLGKNKTIINCLLLQLLGQKTTSTAYCYNSWDKKQHQLPTVTTPGTKNNNINCLLLQLRGQKTSATAYRYNSWDEKQRQLSIITTPSCLVLTKNAGDTPVFCLLSFLVELENFCKRKSNTVSIEIFQMIQAATSQNSAVNTSFWWIFKNTQ